MSLDIWQPDERGLVVLIGSSGLDGAELSLSRLDSSRLLSLGRWSWSSTSASAFVLVVSVS